ncbi:DNA cytosine methyltransferase [Streptomyces sp. MN03-5084-2B]|nr:DNA cytosine methyltransferase [Streptomyces sp. MN03-5084-2B]
MSAPHRDDAAHAAGAGDAAHFVATEGPVIGSLCTGLLGLDLGVAAVLGGRIAWYSEIDPHAERVLAARLPGVPNLGDLRAIDFTGVEQVDVLTAGFPCQDISAAGRRAGIEKGTRSGLWRNVLDAVRVLRPSLVVLENVAALRWKNGGLDHVLGGLAEKRYDAVWRCVRASDIGAGHRRERVFVCAVPQQEGDADDADAAGPRRRTPRPGRPRTAPGGRAPGQPQRRRRLGDPTTPSAADTGRRGLAAGRDPDGARSGRLEPGLLRDADRIGAAAADPDRVGCEELHPRHPRRRTVASRPGTRTDDTRPDRRGNVLRGNTIPGGGGGFVAVFPPARGALLPTPTAHDGSSNGISAASRQGGPSLLDTLRLLPTPQAIDGTKGCHARRGSKGDLMAPSVAVAVTQARQGTATRKEATDRGHRPRTTRTPRGTR